MTPDGPRAIETIKLGDMVYAADLGSYAMVPEKVIALEDNETATSVIDVALSNGVTLRVTPNHQTFDPATGVFKPIGSFKVGERVAYLRLPGGTAAMGVDPEGQTWYPAMEWDARIVSMRPEQEKAPAVFSFTMGGRFHNYLANGVIVHNRCSYMP